MTKNEAPKLEKRGACSTPRRRSSAGVIKDETVVESSPGSPRPEGGLWDAVGYARLRLPITKYCVCIRAGPEAGPRYWETRALGLS